MGQSGPGAQHGLCPQLCLQATLTEARAMEGWQAEVLPPGGPLARAIGPGRQPPCRLLPGSSEKQERLGPEPAGKETNIRWVGDRGDAGRDGCYGAGAEGWLEAGRGHQDIRIGACHRAEARVMSGHTHPALSSSSSSSAPAPSSFSSFPQNSSDGEIMPGLEMEFTHLSSKRI